MSEPDVPAADRTCGEPPDQALIADALQALAGDPNAPAADRLMPALAAEDPRVREAAVALLGRLPDATATLRAFLVHSRGLACWLRERATASLMKISCDIVEPLERLTRDEEPDIRAGALLMASACRDPRVVPRAIEILRGNDEWWIRSIAAETLGNFPCPEARQALLSCLEDPEVRPSVIAALGCMGDGEATGCVLRCLADADRGTRLAALEALAAREGPETLAALRQAALDDPDPALRDKAVAILESHRPDSEPYLREVRAAGIGAGGRAAAVEATELTMERDRPPAGR